MTSDFEIHNLLSKFLSGEATPEEAMLLEDWKARSVANKLYFDGSAAVFEIQETINLNEIKVHAWKAIKTAIDKHENVRKINVARWRSGIAASVVLIITVSFLAYYLLNKSTSKLIYSTETLQKQIRLTDSSEIIIAPNSTVTIDRDFGKSSREIALKGSAFFSVRHDNIKPLIVNMNRFYVKDLGTRFDIVTSANSDTIFVSVSEGEVFVYDDFGSFAKLIVNESAKYIKSTKKLETYKREQGLVRNEILNKPLSQNATFEKANETNQIHPDSIVAKDKPEKSSFSKLYIVIKSQTSMGVLTKLRTELEKWGVYFQFGSATFKNDLLTSIQINVEIPGVYKDSLFSDNNGKPLSESLIFYYESGKAALAKGTPGEISEKGKKIVENNLNGLLVVYDGDKIRAVGNLRTN